MADTPPSKPADQAFFREVDDAVRKDQLTGFWQSYGLMIVAVIVIGLAGFGGWLYWNHSAKEKSGEVAEQAQDVLQTLAGGGNPSAEKMAALEQAEQPGYRAMALLARAGHLAQQGKTKEAAKLYGDIAANAELAQPYRDLGLVRQVALGFEEMEPQQVVDRLKPLAVEGNPWFGSAGEMTAIAYMKMGKKDLAGPMFAAVAKDPKAPATLRSRAGQMAGLLGVDAVETEPAETPETPEGKEEGGN